MYRDQPPCNTCAKHDCRSCAWTSPLDASYRRFIHAQSVLSLLAVAARNLEAPAAKPSWFAVVKTRLARIFSDSSAHSR
ncbi:MULTISPECIES: hypothetical protein [unclassified Caballeronia]|uniref:hypothetical protein n=1 Tax=unclassified Caballeronia TaxID=2646786 RepID=UPI001589BF2F|nr:MULTISPECIES: hypothetical protein [unclassified Caballeronia]QSN63628.1 hypothetical protein JYK05_15560 [Caballeronia sp. M1242]